MTTVYGIGTADGLNERGLGAHALYLTATDFGARDTSKTGVVAALWAQYLLDNAADVNEALALEKDMQPVMVEARAKSPPTKPRTRSGLTGAMIPKAIMSSVTVTRTKAKAARPGVFSMTGEEGEEGEDTGAPKRIIVAGKRRGRKRIACKEFVRVEKKSAPLPDGAVQGRAW